jgi:DNA-binding MarR family transcriptional regulator
MATPSKYLRFLELLSHVNKKYDLSTREIGLLNYIYLCDSGNQVIQVKDLLGLEQLGTQATLHSALTSLIKKKFVRATTSKSDRRGKYLELTGISKTRYSQIEDALYLSVNSK